MDIENPGNIKYDTIISNGKRFSVGHSIGYSLHISGHYFTAYDNLPISYLWVDLNNSKITVYFSDGSVACWENPYFDGYITQYGICISKDGGCIFVQTWENGLYCFSAKTGESIWRTKSKSAIKEIHVNDTTIAVNNRDKVLKLLKIDTGEVISERKININEFWAVDTTRFMCRTSAKKWEVINSTTLETTETFLADDREEMKKWFSVFYS